MILSSNYFPGVQYLSKFLLGKTIYIETKEHFQKQSFRNRCQILAANGVQILSVPTKKVSGEDVLITEVEIDYSTAWQAVHLKSIESAYRSSPFFEFYIDAFLDFFTTRHALLFDFNAEILTQLLTEFEIPAKIALSKEYLTQFPDYRNGIHPKKKFQVIDNRFCAKPYTQVFSSKFPFQENLSALDLLFNEGPNAINILRESIL